MARRYAEDTKVSIPQSKSEIESLVRAQGADGFVSGEFGGRIAIMFGMEGRQVRFMCEVPETQQEHKARYRQLLLTIKAKFESWKSGIETFDDAFMSQIILPGQGTVGEDVRSKITHAYSGQHGEVKLLEGF